MQEIALIFGESAFGFQGWLKSNWTIHPVTQYGHQPY